MEAVCSGGAMDSEGDMSMRDELQMRDAIIAEQIELIQAYRYEMGQLMAALMLALARIGMAPIVTNAGSPGDRRN